MGVRLFKMTSIQAPQSKIILALMLFIVCFSAVSASWLDVAQVNEGLKESMTISESANKYPAISVKGWLGLEDKADMILTEHTPECSYDCESIFNIRTYEDSALVDEVKFYTLTLDDKGNEISRIEQEIRNYKLYIQTGSHDIKVDEYSNDFKTIVGSHIKTIIDWKEYNIGDVLPAGDYIIKLEGQKREDRVIDWIISTQGKEISDWAVWGAGGGYLTHGQDLDGSQAGTEKQGVQIDMKADGLLLNVSFPDGGGYTKAYIYNSTTGAQIAVADIITVGTSKNASFNYQLKAGVSYDILADKEGGTYTIKKETSATFPYETSLFNFTTSVYYNPTRNTVNTVILNVLGLTFPTAGTVTLNSPATNYNSSSPIITFNCSATVGAGTTLKNISLVDNSTGTWKINKTIEMGGSITTNSSTFSQTYAVTNLNWSCRACDSDNSCGYANENRTIMIDTTAPTIRIDYPTGTLNGLTNGQALQLNYSASDINLDTCWREYNGVNTTIASCANTTFNYVLGINSIKVWVNDSVGNTASDDINWAVGLTINSLDYNVDTYETSNEVYRLNVTVGAGTTSLSGKLWYNGTSYSSVITNTAANNYSLYNTLAIPLATAGANKSFFFEMFQYNGTGVNSVNSSLYWQNSGLIHLEKCNATYNVMALNFTAIDENTLARVKPYSFKGTINYWLGDGTTYKTTSVDDALINETIICINPNSTFTIDANIEYGDDNNTYITKDYNLNDYSISNVTKNISLYMIEADDSTTFILRVQDTAQNPQADVYIHIQRYFPGTNTYETVQIAKTNDDGKTVGFYKAETVNYRHLLYDIDGNLLLQTSPGKVFAESVPYTIVFTIGDSPTAPWIDLETLTQLSSSIGYNNNTKIANFTYSDTSSTFESARFMVEKVWGNQSNQVICNVTSTLASAVITCNLASYNDSMIGYGFITRDGKETLVELYSWNIGNQRQIFDKTGLFLAWMIMLVAASIFLYNFIAGMWIECAAIFLVNLIGLASFPALFVWGALALTIIATVVFGKESFGGGY